MCICLCVCVCGGGGRSDKIGICFTFSFSCCALSVLFLLPKLYENNLGLWLLATPEPTLQDCETTPTGPHLSPMMMICSFLLLKTKS